MAASLNLHRLFYTDDGYLKELCVREPTRPPTTLTLRAVRAMARYPA